MSGVLEAIDAAGSASGRLRVHLFFRNVQGLWACTDPKCSAVPTEFRSDERRVGRLYAQPVHQCVCGSRVLELLYCQTCGDLFLGGFRSIDGGQANSIATMLVPDPPGLELVPDQTEIGRTAGSYVVYWPRPTQSVDDEEWDRAPYSFQFRKGILDPKSGRLTSGVFEHTGWSFHVSPQPARAGGATLDVSRVPAFPIKCPNCGDNWERDRRRPVEDAKRTQSPIRAMRTGFEKISQVLTDALLRGVGEPHKLVVFSDSRQDAAKLSAGLEKRHYQDLVRQLLAQAFDEYGRSDIDAYERVESGSKDHEDVTAWRRFSERYPTEALLLSAVIRGLATPEQALQADEIESSFCPRSGSARAYGGSR